MTRACDSKPGRGVPTGPIREHITTLLEAGGTYMSIARVSQVNERTIRDVHSGKRPSVYRGTAECLMAVDPADVASPDRVVDARPTRLRLDELVAGGWLLVDIAAHAGLSPSTLMPCNLTRGVTLRTEQQVKKVWETYMDVEGNGARVYPELADALDGFTLREVAAGSRVSYSTITRIRAQRPIRRETARQINAWLTLQRVQQRQTDFSQAA